ERPLHSAANSNVKRLVHKYTLSYESYRGMPPIKERFLRPPSRHPVGQTKDVLLGTNAPRLRAKRFAPVRSSRCARSMLGTARRVSAPPSDRRWRGPRLA